MMKTTLKDLHYRLREEGEGYAILHYYGRDLEDCDDPEAVRLWAEAHDKIVELKTYIKNKIKDTTDED